MAVDEQEALTLVTLRRVEAKIDLIARMLGGPTIRNGFDDIEKDRHPSQRTFKGRRVPEGE